MHRRVDTLKQYASLERQRKQLRKHWGESSQGFQASVGYRWKIQAVHLYSMLF